MKTSLFDYQLPPELIANSPASPRDHSRLMIINKKDNSITHKYFYNIVDYLGKNDVLVLNNTKVFPARIYGKKETGGKIEVLLHKNISEYEWEALAKPGLKIGTQIVFEGFKAEIIERKDELHIIKFNLNKSDLIENLQKVGITPLPPYIHSKENEEEIRKEYQTTYAKDLGSVAAPTAGFHFTEELLIKIKNKGVQIEHITLHVGMGTFAPVKTETLEEHIMHSEEFYVDKDTLTRLNSAKQNGKRIVAVGSTSTRVLETLAIENCKLKIVNSGSTNLLICPPYKFKFVNVMITNFHLPKSTLMALVYAFGGTELMKKAYQEAINKNYRFYSFGDSSMIIG